MDPEELATSLETVKWKLESPNSPYIPAHTARLLRRMEKAKLLLETTEMKIYEITDAVGYTEIDWFYKKFKEYTGTSAYEYREQCFITA
ncbi:hypothetical protein AMQ84_20560 [Paenibacillus riograndensis]|uniref:HTH araC/xylS-type domain-containing protein n=1 Tax=Paenibacillus riograndensis TaxID=483937 RepID=A0A132TST4_9BACL|nr:helix-turn-helix domain-containing protein [Paenibacillus riograndensis]KWX74392.1 hypothetical protein AMQ84_20560 [Paenibacillus riograndensis]